MPASKPQSLNRSHQTNEEKREREEQESALMPVTLLDQKPPPLLQKRKQARETWTRLVGLYLEVEGSIITAFDADLLTKYCILEEECLDVEAKRADVSKNISRLDKLLANKEKVKQFDAKEYLLLLQQYNALVARWQGLDARADGKKKLLHSLAQSLYLTPRSRAGVAPSSRNKEPDDGFSEFD